jgi:hypothetical protein
MTKEQIDRYEELSKAVDTQVENLLDSSLQLSGTRPAKDETHEHYIIRLQDMIHEVSVDRMYLDEAKAAKKAFVMGL